jgi:Sec-independent protein translocase protein TatA
MDGIFGVGVAEMLIIGLALFVIGGPKNTAKWARELGHMIRQVRQAWSQVMADLENELGPEGKELMDTARELGQGAREVSSMARPSRLVGETMRMVESAVDVDANTAKPASSTGAPPAEPAQEDTATDAKKYAAWLPPEHP